MSLARCCCRCCSQIFAIDDHSFHSRSVKEKIKESLRFGKIELILCNLIELRQRKEAGGLHSENRSCTMRVLNKSVSRECIAHEPTSGPQPQPLTQCGCATRHHSSRIFVNSCVIMAHTCRYCDSSTYSVPSHLRQGLIIGNTPVFPAHSISEAADYASTTLVSSALCGA